MEFASAVWLVGQDVSILARLAIFPSLAVNATASASSEYSYRRPSGKRVHDSAENVIDNENGKGGQWTARSNDSQPWLAIDLKRPMTFQEIYLVERHTRIRQFEVQCCSREDNWQTVYRGNRMNYCSVRLGDAVTAEKVRVNVLKTEGGPPQISRFDLYR